MKYSIIVLPVLLSVASARTNIFNFNALLKREVPQEHSHQKFLTSVQTSLLKNNPAGIEDAVFGLLGDAAAAEGKGKITDVECLQQATADQAFTNAKAAGDVAGMTDALIYRALERNTGGVGLASKPCTSIKAVNPEIAAISQHQDPASSGAAGINKAVTLELAKQLSSIGGNPQDALQSGTFAPGNTSDNTGKGNTCDEANDAEGCIFTQNLLVEDATAAEIVAAVGGSAAAKSIVAASSTTTAVAVVGNTVTITSMATIMSTITVTADCSATAAVLAASSTSASTATSSNVQPFSGSLGTPAVAVSDVGGARPFVVEGDSFVNFAAACQRSCSVQNNKCADAANAGGQTFTVGDCNTQEGTCNNGCAAGPLAVAA